MNEIVLTLYTKSDCHLCEEMEAVVKNSSRGVSLRLELVDVAGDAALEARYGTDVPLLMHGEEQLARHRAHEKTLSAKLRKLVGGGGR
ncbi:MAG: glutaredoxin family protein [Nitrospinae bacterium]|nr:glutaredoxin family protein [Nitrospinota bacterium]